MDNSCGVDAQAPHHCCDDIHLSPFLPSQPQTYLLILQQESFVFVTHRITKRSFAVEYKADFYVSGNAFIETVSVDTTNTPGWALTSEADILVYYFVRWDDPYILPMAVARQIATGPRRHRLFSVPNKDYMTKGLLVPLKELAEQRISEEDFRQGRFQM